MKTNHRGLAAVLIALLAMPAFTQGADGAKPALTSSKEAPAVQAPKPTFANVPYGKHERQVLDFWKADTGAPAPLAFVIHGGGWVNGEIGRAHV